MKRLPLLLLVARRHIVDLRNWEIVSISIANQTTNSLRRCHSEMIFSTPPLITSSPRRPKSATYPPLQPREGWMDRSRVEERSLIGSGSMRGQLASSSHCKWTSITRVSRRVFIRMEGVHKRRAVLPCANYGLFSEGIMKSLGGRSNARQQSDWWKTEDDPLTNLFLYQNLVKALSTMEEVQFLTIFLTSWSSEVFQPKT